MAGDGAAGRAGAGVATPPPPRRAGVRAAGSSASWPRGAPHRRPRAPARQLLSHRAGPGGGAGPGRAWAGVRGWNARAWRAGSAGARWRPARGPGFAARGSVGSPHPPPPPRDPGVARAAGPAWVSPRPLPAWGGLWLPRSRSGSAARVPSVPGPQALLVGHAAAAQRDFIYGSVLAPESLRSGGKGRERGLGSDSFFAFKTAKAGRLTWEFSRAQILTNKQKTQIPGLGPRPVLS